MYIYIYVCIYICITIYMYIYMYIYVCVCVHVCARAASVRSCVHAYACLSVRVLHKPHSEGNVAQSATSQATEDDKPMMFTTIWLAASAAFGPDLLSLKCCFLVRSHRYDCSRIVVSSATLFYNSFETVSDCRHMNKTLDSL